MQCTFMLVYKKWIYLLYLLSFMLFFYCRLAAPLTTDIFLEYENKSEY
jgi:hypothetical protein